eukprot:2073525-Prymnesium_polylepis.1
MSSEIRLMERESCRTTRLGSLPANPAPSGPCANPPTRGAVPTPEPASCPLAWPVAQWGAAGIISE